MDRKDYFTRLQSLKTQNEFETLALKVFRFQSQKNRVYSEFLRELNVNSEKVKSINDIPFLPVELFRSHVVLSGSEKYNHVFTSSGTTSEQASSHYIKDLSFYKKIFTTIFSKFYGNPSDYIILALLPSYLERKGSSLIYMMEELIAESSSKESGFYLDETEKLFSLLQQLQKQKRKTILFGVTFALLDIVASKKINFPELIVMETGGMKGRRKEMVREEVHKILSKGFGVEEIHSEYGMTELISQAYSKGKGIFKTPSWMKVLIRDPYDPFKSAGLNTSGGINTIDLANIDSCAFISTSDLGKVYDDNSFEVIGRFDFSDVRGCNLMVQ